MREVGLPDPSLALDPILRLVPGQDPAEVLRHLDLAWDTPTERDLFTAGGGDEDAWQRWQQAEEEASRQRRQPGGTPWATVTEMLYVCAASKPGGDPIGP